MPHDTDIQYKSDFKISATTADLTSPYKLLLISLNFAIFRFSADYGYLIHFVSGADSIQHAPCEACVYDWQSLTAIKMCVSVFLLKPITILYSLSIRTYSTLYYAI